MDSTKITDIDDFIEEADKFLIEKFSKNFI